MSRANQVISKSYLSGLIIKCGLFFAGGLILTGIILYFSAQQPLGPSYQESFARLAQLKREMLIKSIIIYCTLMFLTIGGVLFITIIYSHRVVGPMVGLTRVIKLIAGGDLTTSAILRKKDAIKPIAEALNTMTNSYKEKIRHIQATTKELEDMVKLPDAVMMGKEILQKNKEIENITSTYKL